jgi:DNA polymerase-3 subunit delta
VFYVLHGADEFSRAEMLAELKAKMAEGDPLADLNTTVLDGSQVTLGELRHACDTVPFMAERRMVIVNGLLSRLAPGKRQGLRAEGQEGEREEPAWKKEYVASLADYLPNLPDTARLFFVEATELKASHPILKLVRRMGAAQGAYEKKYSKPKADALPGWIMRRAREKGGAISSEAVEMLAALVGNDLRLLDGEIEKLLLYAGDRQVTTQDVRALVSRAREAVIFDLVDCVGRRQTDEALKLLHQMLDDLAVPLYLLSMLGRQVRILIQVSELVSQGLTPPEISKSLKLHPFVVKKGIAQSRSFSMAQLEKAHECVVEADWSIKTGRMDDVLALDMLVVDLTQI